jgi:uncharacterized LabA/DUF88 family protein
MNEADIRCDVLENDLRNMRLAYDGKVGGAKIHDYNSKIGLIINYLHLARVWNNKLKQEDKAKDMYYEALRYYDEWVKWIYNNL